MWNNAWSSITNFWSNRTENFNGQDIIKQISSSLPLQNVINTSTDSEIKDHSKLANDCWDPSCILHSLNKLRVPFIQEGLTAAKKIDDSTEIFRGQRILEVGCGGGILTEALADLHANVTGIDLCEEMIKVAKQHLVEQSPHLQSRITYVAETIDDHALNNTERYDVVVLSEVIEHVDDKSSFLTSCVKTLKPGGSIFVTTLNKTVVMWLTGVILAEYVLNIVPHGTHHWKDLIAPGELIKILNDLNCDTMSQKGFIYNIFSKEWVWMRCDSFSYAVHLIKAI